MKKKLIKILGFTLIFGLCLSKPLYINAYEDEYGMIDEDETEDDDEMEDENETSYKDETLYELSETYLIMDVDDFEYLSITYDDEPVTSSNIEWISDNENIAVVNEDGEVTSISEGTTIITVYVDGMLAGQCMVEVMEGYSDEEDDKKDNNKYPTYKQLSSILKKYKNKKGFTYDVIDVGNECRLYGVNSKSETKIYKEALTIKVVYSTPYIELKKIKGKCKISYKIKDELAVVCYGKFKKNFKLIKYKTDNRKLDYSIDKCKWELVNKKWSNGAYIWGNLIKITSCFSSNNDPQLSKLDKLYKMYGQKSFRFSYIYGNNKKWGGIKDYDSYTRKKWQKLIKIYEEALSLY